MVGTRYNHLKNTVVMIPNSLDRIKLNEVEPK